MTTKDLVLQYTQNAWVHDLSNKLVSTRANSTVHIKELVGSSGAVLVSTIYHVKPFTQLIVLQTSEEANYFYSDLVNLLGDDIVVLFSGLEKKSYEHVTDSTTIDNAILEILCRIHYHSKESILIVTSTEALLEKSIREDLLYQDIWTIKSSDKIILSDLVDKLIKLGFLQKDFVYEIGDFAVRGGVFDIFPCTSQFPFRIELSGNDIESMRLFDPLDQRSMKILSEITILPNRRPIAENQKYLSILEILPAATPVWIKDYALILEAINIKNQSISEQTYETKENLESILKNLVVVEFGRNFYRPADEVVPYKTSAIMNYNRNIKLLIDSFKENEIAQIKNIVAAESDSQLATIKKMIEDIDVNVNCEYLKIGLNQGYVDYQAEICIYTDHQIFDRYYRYKSPKRYQKNHAITFKELQSLQPGDYVVHADNGIGRFVGLTKIMINGKQQEILRLVYRDDDILHVGIQSLHKISKFTNKDGEVPSMSKLGSSAWELKKKKVKAKVKDIAKELIELYGKRRKSDGFAFSADTFLQMEMESSFMYEDTPDQALATAAVKKDMELPHPMDRLVCGDVGFGKTEIAIRAAFKALYDKKQVAVLVPTTILAMQHHNSFASRLSDFGVNIAYISRFKSASEVRSILEDTSNGKTNILIGTHKLLSKDVKFNDLGLLIVDEEQKFGVTSKEKIKAMKVAVDVLTLTATPIPRTLHFSLMGAKDLSLITTPPPNRQPVQTFVHAFNDAIVLNAINYELERNGQVFFVHTRVSDIVSIAAHIKKLVPKCRIGIAHGQMEGNKLETEILKFIQHEYDILVSTNIIESGIDIPNANTLIVNDSYKFGLSELHQMRGRVGRSNKKAFCYLLVPSSYNLQSAARQRLNTLEELSDLGDGFKVAMCDLDIRGTGDMLGSEQSGFISDIGFETYCQILDDAVNELKENEFKELFKEEKHLPKKELDCVISTDYEILIPETYVANVSERIKLYLKLDNMKNESELKSFIEELKDRFGIMPKSLENLIMLVRLRWVAQKLGISDVKIKNSTLHCYFKEVSMNGTNMLEKVIKLVQLNPQKHHIQDVNNTLVLVVDKVKNAEQAKELLDELEKLS